MPDTVYVTAVAIYFYFLFLVKEADSVCYTDKIVTVVDFHASVMCISV